MITLYPAIYQTSVGTPRDLGSYLGMRSQPFGANYQYYHDHLGTNGHAGNDWPCPVGTPVYAPIAGRISYIATDFHVESGGGAGVIIECAEGDCLLWHFSRVDVKVGDMVVVGQQVGLSGDTGFSSGPHVHVEWRPLPLQYNNGFFGAVEPSQFMAWQPLPNLQDMFKLVQVPGDEEIWLLKDGKKTHVYNEGALLVVSDFSQVNPITQGDLDAIPDSGLDLATLVKK